MSRKLSRQNLRNAAYEIANTLFLQPDAMKAKVFALYEVWCLRPCDIWVRRAELGLGSISKNTLYRYHLEYKRYKGYT